MVMKILPRSVLRPDSHLAGAPLAAVFDAQSLAKQSAQLFKNALNYKEINLSSLLQ